MRKKLGIFLGYSPSEPMRKEGLGRLLAFLLSAILEDPDEGVTIVAPSWYRDHVKALLVDHRIPPERVKILTPVGRPLVIRIAQMFSMVPQAGEPRWKWLSATKGAVRDAARAIGKVGWSGLVRWSTAPAGWAVAIAVITSPLWLAALLIAGVLLAGYGIVLVSLRLAFRAIRKAVGAMGLSLRRLYRRLSLDHLLADLYREARSRELCRVARLANRQGDVEAWFIPSMNWPEIKLLDRPKIVAAPDIVYVEFPLFFASGFATDAYKRIMQTLSAADRLICHSEHVRRNHLIPTGAADPAKITVIRHGRTRLDGYLSQGRQDPIFSMQNAVRIVQEYQIRHMQGIPAWRDLDFSRTRYIIYSTQFRRHKNIVTLLRAVTRLWTELGTGVRLILTADTKVPELASELESGHLQSLVWSAVDITSAELAAFNHLAACSVNPSLFEGGFPFTFCEAYSVGTPSVMSRIPVVEEMISDGRLAGRMLFDPASVEDMSDKIAYAVENRRELVDAQRALYDAIKPWPAVAKEYLSVIRSSP